MRNKSIYIYLSIFLLFIACSLIFRKSVANNPIQPPNQSAQTTKRPSSSQRNEKPGRPIPLNDNHPLEKYRSLSYNVGKFSTLNNEGELTPNCIDESNLTESETQIAQETFKNHRLNLIELIKKNTKTLNQTDATKQGALRIITVKSFPDEGAKAFENLLQGLKTSLGASKAEKVLSGYPALSLYFSYGCQDVKIKVFDAPDVPGTVTDLSEVEVTTNDPVTGQQLTQGRHTFGTLNRIYDDAFFVPQK